MAEPSTVEPTPLAQALPEVGGNANVADNPVAAVEFVPLAGDQDQIWRVIPVGNGGYVVESAVAPGYCLSMPVDGPLAGQLCLEPILFEAWQIWYLDAPTFKVPVPLYETRHHEFVANPTLEPAELNLQNDHSEELLLLITDRRRPEQPVQLRIPSGETRSIRIDRDPGGEIRETVATGDGLGNWQEQQFVTPIAGQAYYEISVYEMFLQSIAIDRTGTSPNAVEDVNYQPRGIGLFIIPPGDGISDGSTLSPYAWAESQQNPGAVRQLTDKELESGEPSVQQDPLKKILNQFQKQRAAF